MFIVYLETNWLVSYVLPHHAWRADARSLLEAADRGECSLRIPVAAFLEARHVVERETGEHTKAVNAVSESLMAALDHGPCSQASRPIPRHPRQGSPSPSATLQPRS